MFACFTACPLIHFLHVQFTEEHAGRRTATNDGPFVDQYMNTQARARGAGCRAGDLMRKLYAMMKRNGKINEKRQTSFRLAGRLMLLCSWGGAHVSGCRSFGFGVQDFLLGGVQAALPVLSLSMVFGGEGEREGLVSG